MTKLYSGLLFLASFSWGVNPVIKNIPGDYAYTRLGFQTALNDAASYQENTACIPYIIQVAPGIISVDTTITLPSKGNTCSQFVTVRSSSMSVIPADGTRITTSNSGLFNLQVNASINGILSTVAVATCTYWRFEGMEISDTQTNYFRYSVISLGDTGSAEPYTGVDPLLRPNHFEFKHCVVLSAGTPFSGGNVQAFNINANNILIQDSIVKNIVSQNESHAVSGVSTTGPITVRNSYLSASTETAFFGGGIFGAGVIPTFIYYYGNEITKEPSMNIWSSQVYVVSATSGNPTTINWIPSASYTPSLVNGTSVYIGGATGAWAGANSTWTISGVTGSVFTIPFNSSAISATFNGFVAQASNPTWPAREGYVYTDWAAQRDWIYTSGNWVNQGVIVSTYSIMKNMVEFKSVRGFRAIGNDLGIMWYNNGQHVTQDPSYFTFNLTTQPPGSVPDWIYPSFQTVPEPWVTIEDVSVIGNNMHDGDAALQIMGYPNVGGQFVVCDTPGINFPCYLKAHHDVLFSDNLLSGISDQREYSQPGYAGEPLGLLSINEGDFNIALIHNSYLLSTFSTSSGGMYKMGGSDAHATISQETVFSNNILPMGTYGFNRSNIAYAGICSFIPSLNISSGTYSIVGNIFTLDKGGAWTGFSAGVIPSPCTTAELWPTGNQSASSGTAVVNSTYTVKPAYAGSGSDSRDPGANISFVNWISSTAASGVVNPGLDFKLRGIVSTLTGGTTVYFTAFSANACTLEMSTDGNLYANPVSVSTQSRNGRDGRAVWNPGTLTSKTVYYSRITCDGNSLEYGVDGKRAMFISG